MPKSPGRPRRTGEQLLSDWADFFGDAQNQLGARTAQLMVTGRLFKERLDVKLPVAEPPRGILSLWHLVNPEDELGVLLLTAFAINAVAHHEADLDTYKPKAVEGAQEWLSFLEDLRRLASALALNAGLDPVCGSALAMGYLVVPKPEYVASAKQYDPIAYLHDLPKHRVHQLRGALKLKQEVDEEVAKRLRNVYPKLYLAGFFDRLGWRGSADWENRFHQYIERFPEASARLAESVSEHIEEKHPRLRNKIDVELPRPTDHRHLRLIWKRTGESLQREFPDEPQYWAHIVG